MANTITVGRMTFTSPEAIDISSVIQGNRNSLDRNVSLKGQFVADSVTAAKVLRDELISMGNSSLLLPFTYTGDDKFEGYCEISSASVDAAKLATGLFEYNLDIVIKGRVSEMLFESNMSGSLLTNSHSVTTGSTTFAPWHAVPTGTFNYNHEKAPIDGVRSSSDGNVVFFYDPDLRDAAAQWVVDPANFYKGAARVIVNNTTRTGYLTENNPTGVTLSNGIIQLTSGSNANQSRFALKFYDNGSFVSERTIAITSGSSGTEYKLWQTAQILRNEPHECVVRFTTYSDTNGDGRLTVDATVKRGAHHIGLNIQQGPTSDRAANSRINLDVVSGAGALSAATGYLIESAVDDQGQKFMFGSPQGFTGDTTNKLIHITNPTFKTFVGYAYNAGNPQSIDAPDAVRDQYLESMYENVRLVRA